ncbi:MAG TPA: hypothetical protein VJJ21_02160 [Candidatus Nanoarchaeia archaeon]|nr:hypothetical protein [Candidatus Nanoarchaeia archaeon]
MADVAKNFLKIVVGLILILIPVWVAMNYSGWKQAVLDVIQGSILIGVVLVGLLVLVLGFTGLKE